MKISTSSFFDGCRYNNILSVKMYIENNYDINKTNIDRNNGFMLACMHEHLEIIKLIVNEQKFNGFNIINNNGYNAMMSTCKNDNVAIFNYIMKYCILNPSELFPVCCRYGSNNIAKILLDIDKKSCLNARNLFRNYGLEICCQFNNYECAKLIIENLNENDNVSFDLWDIFTSLFNHGNLKLLKLIIGKKHLAFCNHKICDIVDFHLYLVQT